MSKFLAIRFAQTKMFLSYVYNAFFQSCIELAVGLGYCLGGLIGGALIEVGDLRQVITYNL